MNKIVKRMMYLSKNDKYRISRKIKWDMYFLYMGYTCQRQVNQNKTKH